MPTSNRLLPLPLEATTVEDLATPYGTVARYSRGDGPAVLLLHSTNAAGTARELAPLFDRLSRTRRVVAVDWPGFGRSDRPDADYSAGWYAAALDACTADLPAQLDVVALSLPGQYAVARAARFRRLVLISPNAVGRFRRTPTARRRRLARVAERSGAWPVAYRALTTRWGIGYFLRQLYADPARLDPAYARYARAMCRGAGARHAPRAFVCGLLDDPAGAAALRAVDRPVLVLTGDRPRFTDLPALRELGAGRPTIRLEVVPDCGDLPQLEHPDRTAALIEDFLS